MNRSLLIDKFQNYSGYWDMVVIGGGATGLGVAVEAASRGYRTVLFEQHDFSKGTSSRSTKLVHGGVRYLKQGNISLVLEALHERGLLLQNAPHLVHNQSFIVPTYDWWSGPFYGVGMKVYDLMAGKLGLGPSKVLSKEETLEKIPTLEPKGLKGGVIYYDGQFDDARLAINLAQTFVDLNGLPLNYMKVKNIFKSGNMVAGVLVEDEINRKEYEVNTRVVINATGIFTDDIIQMDNPKADKMLSLSQGVHLVLDKEFLPGDSAIMVPHTEDGRVLFAVPWHNKVIVGTTDTPIKEATLEPRAKEEEITFILEHAARYLTKDPLRVDIKSIFTGIRPLVHTGDETNTATISRDHFLFVSESGLVTITGGKWTTYRKMAEDTVNQAALVAGLDVQESKTSSLRIHGWLKNIDPKSSLGVYGSDMLSVKKVIDENNMHAQKIHSDLPYLLGEIIWAVREEMALTVEDILARRTRALLLDAKASIECAPLVAEIMAQELIQDKNWQEKQVAEYQNLAKEYLPV
jgi:glycerol-3-phosphate dehydrogenase